MKNNIKYFKLFILHFSFFIFHFGISVASAQSAALAQSADNAVILMYHNVAENTPPSTSVTPSIFKEHMQYLADNKFIVWPLFKALVHLATGKPVPAKTVVLTFDDAYKSVYNEAFPVLKEKGWPFTVFVTTQYISEDYANFMSWQQLREIKQYGGDIGNHSLSHPHFVRVYSGETQAQWRERIINEVQQAQRILHQNVGYPIWAVAYPYGEYSKEVAKILRELGYFGIGQHSGAVSSVTDFQAIPRFPMATGFDGMEDFAIKVATKNLPVSVLSPDDGIVAKDTDIPVLTVRLEGDGYKKTGLRCYASGQGCIQLEWLEDSVVKVSANEAIKPGRTKYNCTAPSKTEEGVFYWFSFLWMKPEADGRWYSE
ncbi:MAG: polysaccharide deacetylase family protein [Gammaproteobacteria bacterium]|nr:polysaccharide deacetylase family protein [Gammaproteobacteria bacterium]